MLTLRDLALALGLSITQVSRALDDKLDVSAATKIRVKAKARELGYQPNAAARSLRKRKADTVAVVLPSGANHIGLGAIVRTLFDADTHLGRSGFDLIMLPGRGQAAEIDTLRRVVEGRRADAIILVGTRCSDDRVAFLDQHGFPFVAYGRTNGAIPHAYVDGDGEAGFAAATHTLFQLGHTRIAHIAAPVDLNFANLRRLGWQKAMGQLGLERDAMEAVSQLDEASGMLAASELLERSPRPTALLCATDAIAIGAMSAVRQAGLVVGRDISVIGHDALPAGLLTSPPLSSMQIATPDVGGRLASILLQRIGGADPKALQEVLPVQFVAGGSHGPRLTTSLATR